MGINSRLRMFNGYGGYGFPGLTGPGVGTSFLSLLHSLLNFNVSILTEGDVAPTVGLLVGITPHYVTVAGGNTPVTYIPVNKITLVTRVI
ncbi:MAG: hypothetical protein HPY90_01315 [Syntrophothermus sp.]|uniref:hypothetical protein n=1 Tax=Syntrophothermus sp. TaxID=2736299 RepID=UPI00257BD89C|nr:hypothetical protein [Syntrophothermus sp.]NSW81903.1 hypothetical protein [Syntrophothermus sp.]